MRQISLIDIIGYISCAVIIGMMLFVFVVGMLVTFSVLPQGIFGWR